MFCPDLQKPVILKRQTRPPTIDFDCIRAETCHSHNKSQCPDSTCVAILAYKAYLQAAPYTHTTTNQLNLVLLTIVGEDSPQSTQLSQSASQNQHTSATQSQHTCQCLINVSYSASEFVLRVNIIGLDQPSVSHCFVYNNDSFNVLKQKHGLNVNMSEFVGYLNNILICNQPAALAVGDSGVWYSLKLISGKNKKKLLITENRPHRFLLFLSLESCWNDHEDGLADALSSECLMRWNFVANLITVILEMQIRRDCDILQAQEARVMAENQVEKYTKQLASVKSDLSRALDTSTSIQDLRSQDSIVIKQLEEQLQELRNERALLKDRAEKSDQRITAQLAERESMAIELRNLRRELEMLHAQSDENEGRFAKSKELDQQLTSTKVQLEKLMVVNEKLMIEHSSMSAKMAAITTELVELRRAHMAATEEQAALVNEKKAWQIAQAALEDACAKSSVKASQYDLLVAERDELQQNCENLEKDMRKLNLHMAKKLLSVPHQPPSSATGSQRFQPARPRGYTNSAALRSMSSDESDGYVDDSADDVSSAARQPLPLRSAASWARRDPSPTASISAAPPARKSFRSSNLSQFTR